MALFATPGQIQTRKLYNPQQERVAQNLLDMGQNNLRNPTAGFEGIASSAQKRFNEQGVPALLERFAGSGSNALSSGSLKSELSQGQIGLQERLAGLESQYRNQREGLGLQQLGLGLRPQEEAYYTPGDEGFFNALGGGLGTGAGIAAPYLLQNWLNLKGNNNFGFENAAGMGNAGSQASNFAGALGTAGTLGAGAFKGISALGAAAAPYALPVAAGAAGLYGLYRLLSYLKSQRQIPGQQNTQMQQQQMGGF